MGRAQQVEGGLLLPEAAMGKGGSACAVSSDEGGGSSGNEYAEGLGCADSRRCREQPGGQFEFEDHPREEYFEEPQSSKAHAESDDDVPLVKRPRTVPDVPDVPLGETLAELETLEAPQRQSEQEKQDEKQRRMAASARRVEHRRLKQAGGTSATASSAASRAGSPSSSSPGSPADGQSAVVVELRHIARKLGRMREKMAVAGAIRHVADISDTRKTLLRLKEIVPVDSVALKASGAGLELNNAAWKRHSDPGIKRLAADVVAKWRLAVRDERTKIIGGGSAAAAPSAVKPDRSTPKASNAEPASAAAAAGA